MVRSSWRAVGVESGRAVGREDRAMRAEPGRVPAARGEGPHAGDPVAALAFDRADPGPGPPGQHGARIVAEDRLRHRQVEIGRRHGAAAGLAQAPGGRGIGLGDGFDDMEEGDGIGLDPVRRARQQQAEQPRLVQLVEQRRRQPARVLDLVRRRRDIGRRASARAITARSPARSAEFAIGVFKTMPAGPSRPCADHRRKAIVPSPRIGKSMPARSTSANKRLEFRAALHNGARIQLLGRRPRLFRLRAVHAPTLFKVLR